MRITFKFISASQRILFTCFLICFAANLQAVTQTTSKTPTSRVLDKHLALQQYVQSYLSELYESEYNLASDVRIKVRDIDKRISIAPCDKPYSVTTNKANSKQTNISVKVTCDNTNWYLFVHANIAIIQEVVVSKDNLSPGALLSKRNVEVIEVDQNKLRGSTFASITEIEGARIKRRIRAGNIIDGRMLCFVCKGDRVTIAAVRGGLSIKVYGVAQQDGVLGDTIEVRNISSDKLVLGKIAGTGHVEVSI